MREFFFVCLSLFRENTTATLSTLKLVFRWLLFIPPHQFLSSLVLFTKPITTYMEFLFFCPSCICIRISQHTYTHTARRRRLWKMNKLMSNQLRYHSINQYTEESAFHTQLRVQQLSYNYHNGFCWRLSLQNVCSCLLIVLHSLQTAYIGACTGVRLCVCEITLLQWRACITYVTACMQVNK